VIADALGRGYRPENRDAAAHSIGIVVATRQGMTRMPLEPLRILAGRRRRRSMTAVA